MKEKTKSELLSLASRMLRGVGMPNMEFILTILPKRTSKKTLRELNSVVSLAQNEAHRWGVSIAQLLEEEKK